MVAAADFFAVAEENGLSGDIGRSILGAACRHLAGHLRALPFRGVKLDRPLVHASTRSAADVTIIKATMQVAHALGMVVVAEGVETHDQLALLRSLGCDFAQGHLIATPAPFCELHDLLGHGIDVDR